MKPTTIGTATMTAILFVEESCVVIFFDDDADVVSARDHVADVVAVLLVMTIGEVTGDVVCSWLMFVVCQAGLNAGAVVTSADVVYKIVIVFFTSQKF